MYAVTDLFILDIRTLLVLGGSDHESDRRFGSLRGTEGVLLACCREG